MSCLGAAIKPAISSVSYPSVVGRPNFFVVLKVGARWRGGHVPTRRHSAFLKKLSKENPPPLLSRFPCLAFCEGAKKGLCSPTPTEFDLETDAPLCSTIFCAR